MSTSTAGEHAIIVSDETRLKMLLLENVVKRIFVIILLKCFQYINHKIER